MFDIQKASLWKRMSAFLFDFIVLLILAVGSALLVSAITKYDKHVDELQERYDYYSSTYGVSFDISSEDIEKLDEEEKAKYEAASEAINEDNEFKRNYSLVINLTIVITSIGLLMGTLIVEFIVPIFLHNGQTIGKKCFGLGVVKQNCVKISNIQLFVRTILGKYTIEIMIPAILILMFILGKLSGFGVLLFIGLSIFQIILIFFTRFKTPIHDIFAFTVVVDMPSQMIYDNEEELIKAKNNVHSKLVSKETY